jgi:hypothetical protein
MSRNPNVECSRESETYLSPYGKAIHGLLARGGAYMLTSEYPLRSPLMVAPIGRLVVKYRTKRTSDEYLSEQFLRDINKTKKEFIKILLAKYGKFPRELWISHLSPR